jgi:hypothetical protein
MIRRLLSLALDMLLGPRDGPESYVSPTTGEKHW